MKRNPIWQHLWRGALAVAGIMAIGRLCAADAPRSVAGVWDSPFGAVTLQHAPATGGPVAVTGWHDESRDHRAELREGKFDPAIGALEFTFFQPWRNLAGTARFLLSADGRQLAGTYSQPGSSGPWNLTRRAAALSPAEIETITKAATKANTDRKFAEALQLAERALAASPTDETALVEKGKALRDLGRAPEAIAWMEDALRVHPRSAKLHNSLGLTYNRAKQPQQAITHYTAAIQIDPTDAKPRNNLGIVYLDAGDHDRAIAALSEAVRVEPGYALAHRNLGRAYLAKKMPAESAASFERVLQLTPGDATATRGLADARRMQSGGSPAAAPAAPADAAAQLLGALLGTTPPAASAPARPPPTNQAAQVLGDLLGNQPAGRAAAPASSAAPQANAASQVLGDLLGAPPGTTASAPAAAPWAGRVTLKTPAGKLETGRELGVRFSASAVAPVLWFGVYGASDTPDTGAWSECVVRGQKDGVAVLRAPPIPGAFVVRVHAGDPAAAPEAGAAVALRVVLPATPQGDAMAMADVEDPDDGPPVVLPALPEPVVTHKRIASAETESLAAAIAEFHEEWLGANPAQPRRSLQLEVGQPAVAFNLALAFTGKDRRSPLEVGLPLKLTPDRVKAIIGERPVTIAGSKPAAKGGLVQFQLRYPSPEAPKVAAALAELLAESGEFGHPAERSGKKKRAQTPAVAEAKPPAAAPAPKGPLPWQTAEWKDFWPMPRYLAGAPAGTREYHSEISFTKKAEKTGLISGIWHEKLHLRFEWSERGGVEISWLNPRDPNMGNPWTGHLPTLNGRTQLASVLPKGKLFDSKPEGVRPNVISFGVGGPPSEERLQWVEATARADGLRLEVTIERRQRLVARNERVESPRAAAAAPAPEPARAVERPAPVKRPYTGKGFPRETIKDANGNTYETWADGTRTKNGFIIDAANPDTPEDPNDPFGVKSAQAAPPQPSRPAEPKPATPAAPQWVRREVANAPFELKERWEFRGEFDPRNRRIAGTWVITKAGGQPQTKDVEEHVWQYGTELSGGDDEPSAPVWIAQADAPKGYFRGGKPLDLPVKIAAAEKPDDKALSNGKLSYKLVVRDLATGSEIVKPLAAELPPGETTEHLLRLIPPAMSGNWPVRVTLTGAGAEESKDLTIPVGGFPVQFVGADASPRTLVAGDPVTVEVELRNVVPAELRDAPDARGTGTWLLYDAGAAAYVAGVRADTNFDLLPGASTTAVVRVPTADNAFGVWRLALVMLDLAGKTVAYRDLPPVMVNASQVALAEKAEPPPPQAQGPTLEQLWMIDTQRRCDVAGKDLARAKEEIARLKKDMAQTPEQFTDIRERNLERLKKYEARRDEAFADLNAATARAQKFFERRLGEVPKGSQAAEQLAAARGQIAHNAKLIEVDARAEHGDTRALAQIAKDAAKDDPALAAAANLRLGLASVAGEGGGGRRLGLEALRNAAKLAPDNPTATRLTQLVERGYLRDIRRKLDTEMNEAARKFSAEVGEHGEGGFWGTTYDLATIGVGTGKQAAGAMLTGEQTSIEAYAETVAVIEKDGTAQQAGIAVMNKLVDAGLTLEQIKGLDLKQLFAARALASRGLLPGVPAAQWGNVNERERKALAEVAENPEFKRAYPALKKLMDSGTPIPDDGLVSRLGLVRAALNNPDIKALAAPGDRAQLAVDHQGSDAFKSYLGVESLDLTLKEQVERGGLDMVNVLGAVSFVPGAQLSGGVGLMSSAEVSTGRTVAAGISGFMAKVSPRAAEVMGRLHEARREMTFLQQMAIDTTVSIAVDVGVTKATGDAKIGTLTSGLVDVFTNFADAEGLTRKCLKEGIEARTVSTIKSRARAGLEAAGAAEFQMTPLLKRLDEQLAPGAAAEAVNAVRSHSTAVKKALDAEMPASVRAVRAHEADLLERIAKQAEMGTPEGLAEARKLVQQLEAVNAANNGLVAKLTKKMEVLEAVERQLGRNRPLSEKGVELKDEFLDKLGLKMLPDAKAPLTERELDKLMKDPEAVRRYIDAGLLPGLHEQQIATRHAERLFKAREEAMNDLLLDYPEYAQLFHHFRDTGSWPKGLTFRDADMTAKLEVAPPDKLLRALYEKRGLPGLEKKSYQELLAIYAQDDALKRDVLLKFRDNLGFHVGRLQGHPGSPNQVLKEYDIVLNEIPGLPVNGQRLMSSEEYRLKQGFSRAEALLGEDSKVCTRVMFDKKGNMNLRSGYRIDQVRLPGDVPMKLEPQHALAKVFDEWMMFTDHAVHAASDWERVQKVGKYPGRIADQLEYLLHAPEHLVPAKAKAQMAQLKQQFAPLLDEWKAIKREAGEIGYAAATEKTLKGRVEKFRAQFPDATEAQLREMAGGEYLKECQAYFHGMRSATSQIPGATAAIQASHPVGAPFHEYVRQNPGMLAQIVFP